MSGNSEQIKKDIYNFIQNIRALEKTQPKLWKNLTAFFNAENQSEARESKKELSHSLTDQELRIKFRDLKALADYLLRLGNLDSQFKAILENWLKVCESGAFKNENDKQTGFDSIATDIATNYPELIFKKTDKPGSKIKTRQDHETPVVSHPNQTQPLDLSESDRSSQIDEAPPSNSSPLGSIESLSQIATSGTDQTVDNTDEIESVSSSQIDKAASSNNSEGDEAFSSVASTSQTTANSSVNTSQNNTTPTTPAIQSNSAVAPAEKPSQTIDLKKAVRDAFDAYSRFNKNFQSINKQDHNRGKKAKGLFGIITFFNHTRRGIRNAEVLKNQVLDTNSPQEQLECIKTFMNNPSTQYRDHSFASYLCDEIRRLSTIDARSNNQKVNALRALEQLGTVIKSQEPTSFKI